MDLICQKCLTSRTGDVLGAPCRTPGCIGTIEEQPAFATLVDEQPEEMWCPRRAESPLASRNFPNPDHWQKFKSNGDRVCSYCGSLHPDDFLALVKVSGEAPEDAHYHSVVGIEPSDKGYKIYVHRPGVRNAMEGGIKFYTQHFPRNAEGKIDLPEERHQEYATAVQKNNSRFERYLRDIRRA